MSEPERLGVILRRRAYRRADGVTAIEVTYECRACLHMQGWREGDGGLYPCPSCRPLQHKLWQVGHLACRARPNCRTCSDVLSAHGIDIGRSSPEGPHSDGQRTYIY